MVLARELPRTSMTTFSANLEKCIAAWPAEFAPPMTYTVSPCRKWLPMFPRHNKPRRLAGDRSRERRGCATERPSREEGRGRKSPSHRPVSSSDTGLRLAHRWLLAEKEFPLQNVSLEPPRDGPNRCP